MNAERINLLIEKINKLKPLLAQDKVDLIDIDLTLDYTRVLYADLLEWRNQLAFVTQKSENNPTVLNPSSPETIIKNQSSIFIEIPNTNTDSIDSVKKSENLDVTENAEDNSTPVATEKIIIEEPVFAQLNQEHTQEIPLTAQLNQHQKKDIRHFITLNDRFLFMSELFNNDKFDYESALDIINNFKDKTAVQNWIHDNYFATQKWDKDNPHVQTFLTAVQQLY